MGALRADQGPPREGKIIMRYLVTWQFPPFAPEESQARILDLFAKWAPPLELAEFHGYADSSGGMLLVETEDPAKLAAVTAPWATFATFDIKPLVPIADVPGIVAEAVAFRNSVS
jgi:hypothetical protein